MAISPAAQRALDRLNKVKNNTGSGTGMSFASEGGQVTIKEFDTPQDEPFIISIPTLVVGNTSPIDQLPPEDQLPPLDEDQDELRVAARLIRLQAEGIGVVARTDAGRLLNTTGQMDKVINTLEAIDTRTEDQKAEARAMTGSRIVLP